MSSQLIPTSQQSQKTMDFRIKYKTQKCRFLYEKGFCPFNKFCAFAHSDHEMRERKQLNFKYKTKLCHNFFNYGFCKYGDRCQYIHKSFQHQKDGQKTRSNSEESYSSSSSNQQRSRQSSFDQKRSQFKHQNRYQMLKDKNFGLFEIMMGEKSRVDSLMEIKSNEIRLQNDGNSGTFEPEYYSRLGGSQDKKNRLYSM